eukprot:m.70934 g.70934  ORF g.70934 m.70934 type:complete len:108 (+) comp50160_c0_seq6:662-985(+)
MIRTRTLQEVAVRQEDQPRATSKQTDDIRGFFKPASCRAHSPSRPWASLPMTLKYLQRSSRREVVEPECQVMNTSGNKRNLRIASEKAGSLLEISSKTDSAAYFAFP